VKLQSIRLSDLSINAANDRHGELAGEHAAIDWLLTHRANHMRNLAKDIVAENGIYEPPLVHDDSGKYVVYDGNRRVTCLKLLCEPHKAPTKDWADYFRARRSEWTGKFPDRIQCQIEPDRDRLDEILYRRHTVVRATSVRANGTRKLNRTSSGERARRPASTSRRKSRTNCGKPVF
jgi:hypothetical protein